MSTLTNILSLIKKSGITPDKVQLKAIKQLQKIADQIHEKSNHYYATQLTTSSINIDDNLKNPSALINKSIRNIFGFFSNKTEYKIEHQTRSETQSIFPKKINGMYIWGEVGRGKTWLMDLFHKSLEITPANSRSIQRIHFHEFMLLVHKQLQDLPTQPDPLEIVAKNMAQQYQLICLDEFHVMDIADAVILHGLLHALFEKNVTIITTSNRHPDDLYKHGSHRERFLPAIESIKKNMTVLHLDSGKDYRKESTQFEDIFVIPHNQKNDKKIHEKLKLSFLKYAGISEYSTQPISIFGREIMVVQKTDRCIWFTFDILCRGARSSSDYLQIAKNYDVVILSMIPILHEGEEGPARRFLNLIDSFYDQHIYLVLSSAVEIENMYQGDLLQFEFKRALSRLHEMKSHSWWEKIIINQSSKG